MEETMYHISAFYNTTVDYDPSPTAFVSIGDFCFKPVRYLLNGYDISFGYDNTKEKNEYLKHDHACKKSFFTTLLSVVTVALGILLGTLTKGIAYLVSTEIRMMHTKVVEHLTPRDITIGENGKPIDIETLNDILSKKIDSDPHRATNALIIYCKDNTPIGKEPNISLLEPKKLILVGKNIRILLEQSTTGDLRRESYYLSHRLAESNKWFVTENKESFDTKKEIVRQSAVTVEAALKDVPERCSFFSFERKRILYLVNGSAS